MATGATGRSDLLGLVSLLAAARYRDRPAFITAEGWEFSYSALDLAAGEIAMGLRARGLGKTSILGLVMGSTVDYVALYLAASRIGAVTAGINPLLRTPEVAACLARLDADLVVVGDDLSAVVEPGSARRTEVIEPGRTPAAVGGAFRSASESSRRTASMDLGSRWSEPAADLPVCICFTSGTTGLPKGAWFSDRQLRSIAAADAGPTWDQDIAGSAGNQPASHDPYLREPAPHGIVATQFAHVGFMTKLPWLLARGQTTHLLKRWSAVEALELTALHGMTTVNGVAPQIALMLRHEAVNRLDFGAVRAIVAGGAASPPALVREARRVFDAPYSIRYSSTESGGIGLASALDAPDDEACHSIGRPRPGVEVKVCGPDGTILEPGTVGELWLRSPMMMSGYWRDPEATAAAISDGWLRSGDLASVDAFGLYRLAGRAKEMFIRGGYNVYPMEVEAVLGEHRDVAEVVVIGRPDPVMGEIGVAVIVPRDPAEPPSLEELRSFCADALAHYKLPEAVEFVAELPRNSSNKIERRKLIAS